MKHLQRQQYFHSQRQVLKFFLKLQSLKAYRELIISLCWPPCVCFFQWWTRGKKISQLSFRSRATFITKYSSKCFLPRKYIWRLFKVLFTKLISNLILQSWTKVLGHFCYSGAFNSHRFNPSPHPTNNVGHVYPDVFSSFNFV